MNLIDLTKVLDDGKHAATPAGAVGVVAVHRIWFDDWPLEREATVLEICERFLHDPAVSKYTGGELAYHVMIDKTGAAYQTLPLYELGRHAARWNVPAIGVGVLGDTRQRPATRPQYNTLVDVCAELVQALGHSPRDIVRVAQGEARALAGHDELPGGSADPAKRCPGRFLPMDQLRDDVAGIIAAQARQRLLAAGAVLRRSA